MGILLLRLASAPGWRSARNFAGIALTAGAYSAANVCFAVPEFSDDVVLLAARANLAMASFHVAAWIIYAFGGATGSIRELSPRLRPIVLVLVSVGLWVALTGSGAAPGEWNDINVHWAGVQYHVPALRTWAEWYAALMLSALALPFIEFVKRARAGVPGAAAHLFGFTIFFVCSALEVLIANGTIAMLFLADIGFLAVVLPVGAATVRRLVADAGRLDALSQRLTHEVEEQTVALDRAQHALREAERHAVLGRLAAGVAHEINNPLTYMRLNLELVDEWAADQALPDEILESFTSVRDGTERIQRVVEGLRSFTRGTAGEWRRLSPEALVHRALAMAAHQLQQVVQVETDFAARQMIRGDEARLVQVLVSLLSNSAQAIAEAQLSRPVSITVRTVDLSPERIGIEVVDTGPGMPAEVLRCLATPYFTTRASSGRTGLGLFLAKEIVQQHGGHLEVTSELGTGTTASVQLLVATVDDEPEESSPSLALAVLG